MATKKVNTRVMNKCDLDENWRLATNFTPKKGEVIVYLDCADTETSTNYITGNTKFKIGDGKTVVGSLPFQESQVIELSSVTGTLSVEDYNTLTASPCNKIKYSSRIYDLQEENTTSLVYTNNYLNEVKRLTINKTTLQITTEEFTLPNSHYTAKIVVGDNSSSTNNASTTNEHTYIKLVDGGVRRSYHKIQGGGATTVASDNSGNITITSTDAHVTSVNNHYTPAANSTSEISKDASSTTEATWGTTSLVTGVNIQRDAKGHVTGMTLDSIKMPAKPEGGSSRPKITLSTNDAQSYTSDYGRTYYTWPNVGANIIDSVAAGEYDVTIYDQTSGGGYYCPLTGTNMTWIGENILTGDISPSELVGWAFKAKESTALSFWRDEWDKQTHISLDDGTL